MVWLWLAAFVACGHEHGDCAELDHDTGGDAFDEDLEVCLPKPETTDVAEDRCHLKDDDEKLEDGHLIDAFELAYFFEYEFEGAFGLGRDMRTASGLLFGLCWGRLRFI